MKIDFSSIITDVYDRAIKDADVTTDLTLGNLCIFALSVGLETDRNEDPRKKFERFQLCCKIAQSDKSKSLVELVANEVTLLKERIANSQPNAIVVGRAWMLLDEAEAPKT